MENKCYSAKFMYAFYMHQQPTTNLLLDDGNFIVDSLEDEHELSLGILMHVKCIHELCTITLVFHSYLHHIKGILLLFNDFW